MLQNQLLCLGSEKTKRSKVKRLPLNKGNNNSAFKIYAGISFFLWLQLWQMECVCRVLFVMCTRMSRDMLVFGGTWHVAAFVIPDAGKLKSA